MTMADRNHTTSYQIQTNQALKALKALNNETASMIKSVTKGRASMVALQADVKTGALVIQAQAGAMRKALRVQAQMGASANQLAEAQRTVNDVAKETGRSQIEVARALEKVTRETGSAAEGLRQLRAEMSGERDAAKQAAAAERDAAAARAQAAKEANKARERAAELNREIANGSLLLEEQTNARRRALEVMGEFGGTQAQITQANELLTQGERAGAAGATQQANAMRGLMETTENASVAMRHYKDATFIASVEGKKAEDVARELGQQIKGLPPSLQRAVVNLRKMGISMTHIKAGAAAMGAAVVGAAATVHNAVKDMAATSIKAAVQADAQASVAVRNLNTSIEVLKITTGGLVVQTKAWDDGISRNTARVDALQRALSNLTPKQKAIGAAQLESAAAAAMGRNNYMLLTTSVDALIGVYDDLMGVQAIVNQQGSAFRAMYSQPLGLSKRAAEIDNMTRSIKGMAGALRMLGFTSESASSPFKSFLGKRDDAIKGIEGLRASEAGMTIEQKKPRSGGGGGGGGGPKLTADQKLVEGLFEGAQGHMAKDNEAAARATFEAFRAQEHERQGMLERRVQILKHMRTQEARGAAAMRDFNRATADQAPALQALAEAGRAYQEAMGMGVDGENPVHQMTMAFERQTELIHGMNDAYTSLAEGGIRATTDALGGMISNLSAGTFKGGEFAKGLIGSFGSLFKQVGTGLILLGSGVKAIVGGITSPAAAIAIGTGLVVIGGAMEGFAARGSGGGSGAATASAVQSGFTQSTDRLLDKRDNDRPIVLYMEEGGLYREVMSNVKRGQESGSCWRHEPRSLHTAVYNRGPDIIQQRRRRRAERRGQRYREPGAPVGWQSLLQLQDRRRRSVRQPGSGVRRRGGDSHQSHRDPGACLGQRGTGHTSLADQWLGHELRRQMDPRIHDI